MGDRFVKLYNLGVNKETCEGDRFKISKETFSKKNLNLENGNNTGFLLKIFVRNKEGHGYFGYVPLPLLVNSLDINTVADTWREIEDVEVPCSPSERCRIASLMVGNKFLPTQEKLFLFVRITIVTDENSSFEIAVSSKDLREHLLRIGWF